MNSDYFYHVGANNIVVRPSGYSGQTCLTVNYDHVQVKLASLLLFVRIVKSILVNCNYHFDCSAVLLSITVPFVVTT